MPLPSTQNSQFSVCRWLQYCCYHNQGHRHPHSCHPGCNECADWWTKWRVHVYGVYARVRECVCTYVYTCAYTYECLSMCICVCMCVCVYMRACVSDSVSLHPCPPRSPFPGVLRVEANHFYSSLKFRDGEGRGVDGKGCEVGGVNFAQSPAMTLILIEEHLSGSPRLVASLITSLYHVWSTPQRHFLSLHDCFYFYIPPNPLSFISHNY